MTIRTFKNNTPQIAATAWVDEMALVLGDVALGEESSVWPMAVIRGDVHKIRIGARTNIQDGAILHVSHDSQYSPGGAALMLGDDITIGHGVILHGCTIGNRCLIGMGSLILDHAEIPEDVMIAAKSLVPSRKKLESGFLYRGTPVEKVRPLTPEEKEFLQYSAHHYVTLHHQHRGSSHAS